MQYSTKGGRQVGIHFREICLMGSLSPFLERLEEGAEPLGTDEEVVLRKEQRETFSTWAKWGIRFFGGPASSSFSSVPSIAILSWLVHLSAF